MDRFPHRFPHPAASLLLAGVLVGAPLAATLGVPHAAGHVQPRASADHGHAHDAGHAHAHPHAPGHEHHLAPEAIPEERDAGHGHEHSEDVPPHRHELEPATQASAPSGLHGPDRSVSGSPAVLRTHRELRGSGEGPTLDRPGPDPPQRRSLLCVYLL